MEDPHSILSWMRHNLTMEVVMGEACELIKVDFKPFSKKHAESPVDNSMTIASVQKKLFSPLTWYVDPRPGQEDPLYESVKKMFLEVDLQVSLDLVAGGPSITVNKNLPNAGRSTQYMMLLRDDKRAQLTYDQVFALYLIDMADVCQQDEVIEAISVEGMKCGRIFDPLQFYKIICVFVQLYRGCFIDYLNAQVDRAAEQDMSTLTICDPATIPLIANEFNQSYLPSKVAIFTKQTALDLTSHLCNWLFNRGLSTYQVSPNAIPID